MINKIYKCSLRFYEHHEKLKYLLSNNVFLNTYQSLFQKNTYFTDKYTVQNNTNKYPILLSKGNKRYNDKKYNLKARTILFAHLFGLFVHSNKEENSESKNINFIKSTPSSNLKTKVNKNIEGKNEINEMNKDSKYTTNLNKDYNSNKINDLPRIRSNNNESKDDKYEYYQELSEYSNIQIFSSNSHHELANEICSNLGISLGRAYVGKYSDGEIALQIMDEVRGRDIYIIHSTPPGGKDIHSGLMELFLFISALRRASAKKVTAVIPYLNYSRQAKQLDESNYVHSLGAPEVAILLQTCGVDAIVSVDLHNPRIEGFSTKTDFQAPIMNINPQSLAVEYFKKKNLHNPVVVSIDHESGERTKEFWIRMKKHSINAGFTTVVSSTVSEMRNREKYPSNEINIHNKSLNNKNNNINYLEINPDNNNSKNYIKFNEINDFNKEKNNNNFLTNSENIEDMNKKNKNPYEREKYTLVGDIKGCDCVLVDDIIDTDEKSQKVAALLKKAGARKIYLYATHAILSNDFVEKINNSCIDEVVTTNTIYIPSNICCEKLHILSVAKLVAEGIKRVHNEYSQTALEDFSDGQVEIKEN